MPRFMSPPSPGMNPPLRRRLDGVNKHKRTMDTGIAQGINLTPGASPIIISQSVVNPTFAHNSGSQAVSFSAAFSGGVAPYNYGGGFTGPGFSGTGFGGSVTSGFSGTMSYDTNRSAGSYPCTFYINVTDAVGNTQSQSAPFTVTLT